MLDFFRVVPKKRVVKIKKKKGILYHNPNNFRKTVFYVGTICFVASIVYLVYLYYPLGRAIFNYKTKVTEIKIEDQKVKDPENFYVSIPKIGAYSEVKINVDPFNDKEYLPILDNNLVAHAKNTSLPGLGKGKTTYIFAHSSQQGLSRVRNNSVFYLINELKSGDIIFIKEQDMAYTYVVYDKKVVSKKEIFYIGFRDPENEVLLLQTCWPIGTDWKRLIVFAKRNI